MTEERMTEEKIIVVVDDSPSIRETVAFILEMEGFTPMTAVNGREGLDVIRKLKPKVVLLDCMMPEMDGFEVCEKVRADPDLGHTKVIMLTAMGQKADEERAIEAGADYFLTKPFDHDEALGLLNRIFGH